MARKTNRRDFLRQTTIAGAGFWVFSSTGCTAFRPTPRPRRISPNEKLNIAAIGAGGMAASDIRSLSSENFVALCDVDHNRAAKSFDQHPKAKRFYDFRKMLDAMDRQIDGVLISTPDHTHAVATLAAMKMGKHVYCQKPLTHDVYEARVLTKAAKKYNVVTQMGNQGTGLDKLREAVDVIQSGVIGPVREAHIWTNRPIWPQGIGRPTDRPAIPSTLKWNLWLGTAPERPYHRAYHPFKWRGWWDFGTGALGDMACHTANMAFMALKLGYPTSVEAEMSGYNPETYPTWSVIRYEFPARDDMPPLKWVWYDGGNNKPAKVIEQLQKLAPGQKLPRSGSLLVGDKGTLYSPNDYGADYKLLPEADFAGDKPPAPQMPRLPGAPGDLTKHYMEWVRACKGQTTTTSNFAYAGPLTETVVLGCVAMRAQERIEWDGPNMKVTNCPRANDYLRREYRKPWSLD